MVKKILKVNTKAEVRSKRYKGRSLIKKILYESG